MGFAQHQSFYLRPQWLNKGMTEIKKNPRFFYEADHFETLGVGKNMAKSIRYWMHATCVIEEVKSTHIEHHLTKFGELVEQYDPYLQRPFTIGLLHYFLTTDKDTATTWYWFFNHFKEDVFDRQSALEALESWVKGNIKKSVSASSLKRDIDCLFLTYLVKEFNNLTPEEVIRSPFEELGLMTQTIRINSTKMPLLYSNNYELLFASLLLYSNKYDNLEFSIEELVNAPELWGKIFNLNRSTIVEIILDMQKTFPVTFTRTNRLDIVRIKEEIDPISFIQSVLEREVE